MSWKRLLLLDDDHFARVMLAANLRAQGYDVLDIEPGAGAEQLVAGCPVDLAIVALTADRGDSVDALACLYAHRPTPSIALTNTADRDLVRQACRLGSVALMEKPVDIEGLLRVIEQALCASPARFS